MEAPKLLLLILLIPCDLFIGKSLGDGVTHEESKELRDEVTLCLFSLSIVHKQIDKIVGRFEMLIINFNY